MNNGFYSAQSETIGFVLWLVRSWFKTDKVCTCRPGNRGLWCITLSANMQYTLQRYEQSAFVGRVTALYSITIRRRSDYIRGFVTPAIRPNKSKKLTRLISPAHNICSKVRIKNSMHGFTDNNLLSVQHIMLISFKLCRVYCVPAI